MIIERLFCQIFIKTHFVGAHLNRLGEAILMSTHNIGFYEEINKIIQKLSLNIIKYAPYLFIWVLPIISIKEKAPHAIVTILIRW